MNHLEARVTRPPPLTTAAGGVILAFAPADNTMKQSAIPANSVRFGVYEFDLRSGELRKHGIRIKLQEQPCQILAILLEHRGEMVAREELQRRLWPSDTFVDFDHSLNTAVMRLREALNDSSENPRFIETLPRRGYRFVAPVEEKSASVTETAQTETGRSAHLKAPLRKMTQRSPLFRQDFRRRPARRLAASRGRKLCWPRYSYLGLSSLVASLSAICARLPLLLRPRSDHLSCRSAIRESFRRQRSGVLRGWHDRRIDRASG